jgi:hypothetical protein
MHADGGAVHDVVVGVLAHVTLEAVRRASQEAAGGCKETISKSHFELALTD